MTVIGVIRFVVASALLITLAHALHFLCGRLLRLSPAQRVSLGRIALAFALGLAFLSIFTPARILFLHPALHAFANEGAEGNLLALSTSPQIAEGEGLRASASFVAFVLALFGTGALFLLVQSAVTFIRLRRLLAQLPRLRRLGHVEIFLSESVRVPFSMSFAGRALVVLPDSLLENPTHLRLALRHELLHHRRRDTIWCVALAGLRAVWFWVPSAYALSKDLVELSELAVDEALLSRRNASLHDYAECLLAVATHTVNALDFKLPNAVSGMADANQSQLKRRMEIMIANQRMNSPRALVFAALTAVALLSTAAIASRSVVADHSESPADAQANALLEKAATLIEHTPAVNKATYDLVRGDLKECIALGPSEDVLAVCYRDLGVVDARAGNRPEAAEYLKLYLPYAKPDERPRIELLIKKFSAQ